MIGQKMWAACAVTGVAVFLCGLDHLVLLTAMPAIRVTFAAQEAALGWLINAYILPVAILPPSWGCWLNGAVGVGFSPGPCGSSQPGPQQPPWPPAFRC